MDKLSLLSELRLYQIAHSFALFKGAHYPQI